MLKQNKMKDMEITKCRMCGEEVVVTLAEACEFPMCYKVNCFKRAFPDDYQELIEEIEEYQKQNIPRRKKWITTNYQHTPAYAIAVTLCSTPLTDIVEFVPNVTKNIHHRNKKQPNKSRLKNAFSSFKGKSRSSQKR